MTIHSPEDKKPLFSKQFISDVLLGISDGLTVPFALAAGLSGVFANTNIIITAGLAEIAAGCISMGVGGYLSARNDREHYENEHKKQLRRIHEHPETEAQSVVDILKGYDIDELHSKPIVEALKKDSSSWTHFMMRFKHELEEPEKSQALKSGATIGLAYVVGGFIPLLPYIVSSSVQSGLLWSTTVTLLTLVVFGYLKGRYTGVNAWSSSVRMTVLGGLAAGTAYAIARWIA